MFANSTNTILEPMQEAYSRRHSTETALVKFQNNILIAMVNMLLLLDISAASILCHPVLINRLDKRVGTKGKYLDWSKSYLQNKQQRVNINNAKSKSCALKFEVPQGSGSGPILFILLFLIF